MKIRPRNHETRTKHNLVDDERKQEKNDRADELRDRSLYHNRKKYGQECHNSRKKMVYLKRWQSYVDEWGWWGWRHNVSFSIV